MAAKPVLGKGALAYAVTAAQQVYYTWEEHTTSIVRVELFLPLSRRPFCGGLFA